MSSDTNEKQQAGETADKVSEATQESEKKCDVESSEEAFRSAPEPPSGGLPGEGSITRPDY
jgi:hypothetical protein